MERKVKRNAVVLLLIASAVIVCLYEWNFRFSTDITPEEIKAIDDYHSYGDFFANDVILGEEKVSEDQTNYYVVAYLNYYKETEPGVITMTPYLGKSRKALKRCKQDNVCALEIFKTTGSGEDMKVIGWEQGISSEGMERSPYARNAMILKAKLYHASNAELAKMDEDNLKRIEEQGCVLKAPKD